MRLTRLSLCPTHRPILQTLLRTLTTPERTMEVCDVCGIFINSSDNEQRRMVSGLAGWLGGWAVRLLLPLRACLLGRCAEAGAGVQGKFVCKCEDRMFVGVGGELSCSLTSCSHPQPCSLHACTPRASLPPSGALDGQAVPGLEEDPRGACRADEEGGRAAPQRRRRGAAHQPRAVRWGQLTVVAMQLGSRRRRTCWQGRD